MSRPGVMPFEKYRPFRPFEAIGAPRMRRWPAAEITTAPTWCSVDLRDGNQALVEPMDPDAKLRLFRTLVDVGFDEIEVGFPSASQPDFDFVRTLIDGGHVPDHVTIQVLVQCRPHLIERTYEALRGAPRAVVHFYNSTSVLQRDVVFGLDRAGITAIATDAAKMLRDFEAVVDSTDIRYEYSPESFTGTEVDFAVEICASVADALELRDDEQLIVNVPATVEMYTPNVYADVVEHMHRNLPDRDRVILSVHPHNDRGTAVAAAELALLAGAQRVEGTLFGNGERTGNVDLVTLALNLHTQGVDARLDLRDLDAVAAVTRDVTGIGVHVRHPYVGELVHTAFSGSHQDAIKKGMDTLDQRDGRWEVPYLPIDPTDIGRTYTEIIRVNSQSGKSGGAWLLRRDYGYDLPRELAADLSSAVQSAAEERGGELDSTDIAELFEATYVRPDGRFTFRGAEAVTGERTEVTVQLLDDGEPVTVVGAGNGPIAAFVDGLADLGVTVDVVDYTEHAIGMGADARAVAYVQIRADDGDVTWGAGVDESILVASLRAVAAAVNRVAPTI